MIFCTFFMFSCIKDNLEDCYNVQITYRYAREGSTKNMFQGYIRSVNEYVFDGEGVLCKINVLPEKANISTHELPPGDYTLISWGNQGDISRVNKNIINIGETSKEDMIMYLNQKILGHSERLYYTYRTFRVNSRGISYIHTDMVQAYCLLNMTIHWRSNPPNNTKPLYLLYNDITSAYSFMPDWVYEKDRWDVHIPWMDNYPTRNDNKVHYFPGTKPTSDRVTHRQDVKINVDKKVKATFVTYRYTNSSSLLLSLYWGDELIMKEIALDRFFREMSIDLEKTLHQEYNLDIEIDGEKVNVSFVSISDWEEGGPLN